MGFGWKKFQVIFATLFLSACWKDAKIEEFSKEIDSLVAQEKNLEAGSYLV